MTLSVRSTAFLPTQSAPLGSVACAAENILAPSTPLSTTYTSHLIGLETIPSQSFDAVLPDSSLLFGMGSVLILCIVAAIVWANEVVPVSRTKLAVSKSRGEVREYLDGLEKTNVNNTEVDAVEIEGGPSGTNDGRDFERWLFSDWLNKSNLKGGRQKEPALPILKDAKWNSGDNPVLVTVGIMMIGILLASITERVSS